MTNRNITITPGMQGPDGLLPIIRRIRTPRGPERLLGRIPPAPAPAAPGDNTAEQKQQPEPAQPDQQCNNPSDDAMNRARSNETQESRE